MVDEYSMLKSFFLFSTLGKNDLSIEYSSTIWQSASSLFAFACVDSFSFSVCLLFCFSQVYHCFNLSLRIQIMVLDGHVLSFLFFAQELSMC
jgi:hypothetical protein